MSYEEFAQLKRINPLLFVNKPMSKKDPILFSHPSSIDWRTQGVVPDVRNQGQCDSSEAFSYIDTLQARWAIKTGEKLVLSFQQLLDCDSTYVGCSGG